MRAGKKMPLVFMAMAAAGLLAGMTASCASTGSFMPLSQGETVIGTVQTSFAARNALNSRDAINTHAYIKLLEAAQGRYAAGGAHIDIRDIVWVSGKDLEQVNKEYSATGKVVRLP